MGAFQLNIGELLRDAGLEAGEAEVESVSGGGNNRVFVVHAASAKYIAKSYYSHPADTRNRLGAEFALLSYAWSIGLRCVPRPVFCNPEKNIGLYEFVEGRKLAPIEIGPQQVSQAIRFFAGLNANPSRNLAGALPTASEGCFCIEDHFALVDRRLGRLENLPVESDVDRQALAFVGEMGNLWRQIKARISGEIGGATMRTPLDLSDRCISPSDFGFHNALQRDSGEICFLDFEYAGWDDPAKTIGDFFSQPAVPVAIEYLDTFLEDALAYSANSSALEERTRLLFPVFQLKWCCIMLNEFLPDAARRRSFANPELVPQQSKLRQLEKAQQFFNSRLA